MNLTRMLSVPMFAATIAAQSIHAVPQTLATGDGPAVLSAPGIGLERRMQVVISGAELQAIAGHELTGVMLRRDTSWTEALPSASGQIIVRIGAAGHPPDQAVRSFAGNLPSAIEAYRGTILAPASPASPPTASWSASNSIRIDVPVGFAYQGGALCIEFDVISSAGVWWPIDATTDVARGSALSIGSACGRLAYFVETAGVGDSGLVVGRTASFHLVGEPLAPAWLLLGFGILSNPIDLGFLGAAGCELYTSPLTALPTSLSSSIASLDDSGLTNVDVQIPPDTGLFGIQIAGQFVELAPSGLATSNAILCQIASVPPALPMTMVVSRAGEQPDVISVSVPVLGILWQ